MQTRSSHGRKLTQREYERAVVALYARAGSSPAKTGEEMLRRRELDLTIDHRLGVDFPAARREALWQIQQNIERRRLRLLARSLLVHLVPSLTQPRSTALANFVLKEYAQALSPEEMETYFGPREDDPT